MKISDHWMMKASVDWMNAAVETGPCTCKGCIRREEAANHLKFSCVPTCVVWYIFFMIIILIMPFATTPLSP